MATIIINRDVAETTGLLEDVQCPICTEMYNTRASVFLDADGSRSATSSNRIGTLPFPRPRQAKARYPFAMECCGHTLCLACYEEVLKWREGGAGIVLGRACPFCRKPLRRGRGLLNGNPSPTSWRDCGRWTVLAALVSEYSRGSSQSMGDGFFGDPGYIVNIINDPLAQTVATGVAALSAAVVWQNKDPLSGLFRAVRSHSLRHAQPNTSVWAPNVQELENKGRELIRSALMCYQGTSKSQKRLCLAAPPFSISVCSGSTTATTRYELRTKLKEFARDPVDTSEMFTGREAELCYAWRCLAHLLFLLLDFEPILCTGFGFVGTHGKNTFDWCRQSTWADAMLNVATALASYWSTLPLHVQVDTRWRELTYYLCEVHSLLCMQQQGPRFRAIDEQRFTDFKVPALTPVGNPCRYEEFRTFFHHPMPETFFGLWGRGSKGITIGGKGARKPGGTMGLRGGSAPSKEVGDAETLGTLE